MFKARNGTAYSITGPEDAPVVALIHGLGLKHTTWREYVPALSQHYRVLNYDLYGHGDSSKTPTTASLSVYANQLRGLIDELDIQRCALVGFSLGGMINRRFAMDFPECASALAVLNSPHERGDEAQKLVEERAAKTAEGGPAATIDATIERWFTEAARVNQTDLINEVRAQVLSNNPESYVQARQVLAKGVVELIRPQPPITAPTLVMTCENDSGSTPAMSHGIAAEIAGAKTEIVPHLQHMGLVEQPQLFIDPLMVFLSDVYS